VAMRDFLELSSEKFLKSYLIPFKEGVDPA